MDLNRVTLIGNVSQVPEQRTLTSGARVTRLHLATNHRYKDATTGEKKEKASFHSIIAWNTIGDNLAKYLKKGERLFLEGRLDYHTFVGKDGVTRYYTNIIAEKMIMLGALKRGAAATTAAAATADDAVKTEPDISDTPFTDVA